jgi:hypothetical protein
MSEMNNEEMNSGRLNMTRQIVDDKGGDITNTQSTHTHTHTHTRV